jgi:hypothetical protein
MSDRPKKATEMTAEEYRVARLIAIRPRPAGMSAGEFADLASRRDPAKPPKDALEMTDAEYGALKSRAIRNSY